MAKPKTQRKSQNSNTSLSLFHPPSTDLVLRGKDMKLRFQGATSVRQGITTANILDTLLFAASATVGYDVLQSIKIKYIEIWSIATTNVPSTISLEFAMAGSSGDTPMMVFTDTTLGSAFPSHLKVRPPAKSAAAQWQTSASENYLQLTLPANSVIDICFEYTMFSAGLSQAQNALVAATPGSIYARGLDGLGAATSTIPMVSGTYANI
jgi:hypothetical protein